MFEVTFINNTRKTALASQRRKHTIMNCEAIFIMFAREFFYFELAAVSMGILTMTRCQRRYQLQKKKEIIGFDEKKRNLFLSKSGWVKRSYTSFSS